MPRGGKRPGTGGRREGAGRKPLSEHGKQARTARFLLSVEPDLSDWLKQHGGSKFAYELLRKAFIESLIV